MSHQDCMFAGQVSVKSSPQLRRSALAAIPRCGSAFLDRLGWLSQRPRLTHSSAESILSVKPRMPASDGSNSDACAPTATTSSFSSAWLITAWYHPSCRRHREQGSGETWRAHVVVVRELTGT